MNISAKKVFEQSAYKKALCAWLSSETTGYLGAYMYTDDPNDSRWKAGHSSSKYYYTRDERAAYEIALKSLHFTVENFIDLGPGGGVSVIDKSLPVLKAVKAKNYYPVDLSVALAKEALATMQKAAKVGGAMVITDFFDPLPCIIDNALLSIMGGTIGNFESHPTAQGVQLRLSQIFSNYRRAVKGNSYFLLSFDANDNANEIIDCYANPQFCELIKSRIQCEINMDGFDYNVVWTKENHQLAMGLRSNKDQIIKFEGCEFALEKDEFLPVLNSYRFPVEFIHRAAANAGWKHRNTWTATGRVHYSLFSS